MLSPLDKVGIESAGSSRWQLGAPVPAARLAFLFVCCCTPRSPRSRRIVKIIARSGGGGGGVVLGGGPELELKPENAVVVELPVCWLLLVVVRAHSLRPQAFHQQLLQSARLEVFRSL